MSRHVCGLLLRTACSTHYPISPQWPNLTQRARLSLNSSGSRCKSGVTVRFLSTREDLDFQLSRTQVNSILRANEQSVSVPEFDGRGLSTVRKFESNQVAANTPNEDRRSAATCLQTKGMLFGVFDGHGGWACAQAVSERLLYYVAVAMLSQRGLEELELCMERSRPLPPILQWYKSRGDYSYSESASLYVEHLRVFWQELLDSQEHCEGMSPPDALEYAFKRLDTDISLEAQVPHSSGLMRGTAIQVAFAGSTACVAHVGTEGIYVANAGDCRAVLGVQEEDGSWSALPLSQDHTAQNQAELERLRAQHPPSERDTVVMEDRLLGILMPLRSFGDVRFKWSRELQQSVLESLESGVDLDTLNLYQYTPPNYLTPPYLDVVPQLTYHRLRPKDRFLLLASDGLWDEMTSEEAVRLVGEHLSGIHFQAPISPSERQFNLGQMQELLLKRRARAMPSLDPNAATHLIRHALGTGDYRELCQERLSSMLALPEDLARMYRDDITATVVYLNSDLVRQHS
ncbi:pyruvate dehydrogenase [acetyl-transferring]-phosphatase 2, mitochondrial [Esox lucius]|uniref:PPM-type phosphatase domain-containing protein n=1 Tax=Esox lucius TaxID=8010 RepID=A0AAY5K3K7_ESOLU|nr:pyruvate dehydrogenase [acetyl-transferring]-phosphatase 2, mitochondrial [Esox lucius]XP_012994403.1 pyruvate dehydrogenase [acetyl-transferring]-phosphatase 2, mitochondrial [Esox lucius]XP_012994404.1 pyruvate dehydrogenase [acetyl-transferring]-phosphatase 2, mitochondrial [Esox lucius]XP_012994405.1 pyruvate dehydrogenase [acetyl-transferring]-phosphatase 2, mitochondrial [Esox lucius]XP_012994406.1 pyruvate dehydrogenase [acetyl-transferring]-phosphatase 2, mitochondrial [Esox lucius]